MRKTVQEDLHKAFESKQPRLTVGELRDLAGLPIDRSAVSRKLRGKTPWLLHEAEAVARVLGRRLVVRPSKGAA